MSRKTVFRGILPLVIALTALTACTSTVQAPSSDQTLPPNEYAINGMAVTEPPAEATLYYKMPGSYRNQAYHTGKNRFPVTTLDQSLPNPQPLAGPLISDYQQLDPVIRDLSDINQRAIMATRQRVLAHQPVNLLPGRLSFAPKPDGAQPEDTRVKDDAGHIDTVTFGAAYIERKDGVTRTVLVTLSQVDLGPDSKIKDQVGAFKLWYGALDYLDPYTTALPGPDSAQGLWWRAVPLQSDCSALNTTRGPLSSGCAYADNQDIQPYAGNKYVILVAPLAQVEMRQFGVYSKLGGGTEVDSVAFTLFMLQLAGADKPFVEALNDSGWPYSAPPFEEPVSRVLGGLLADGIAVGGNDVVRWPAYAVASQ